jgi:uncharacterized RDD family membrane protein YckC
LGRKVEVTIPLSAEAARPFDPAAHLEERAAAEGRELPLSKPLSRKAERVVIAVIAAVVVAGTVLAFSLERPSRTGAGWLFGVVGGAVLAALIWAHLRGGIDKVARSSRAAAQLSTSAVASARHPVGLPASYRLAPVRARLVAGLLDQALVLLPLLVLVLLDDEGPVSEPVFTSLVVLAFAIFLLGDACSLWLTNGRTPGRKLLGIRVVRADGTRMTLRRALRRELGGFARAGLLEGVQSLASMSMDDLRRSSADNRARTVVVIDDR